MVGARRPIEQETTPVRVIRTLARFSYTLYVVHLPLLVLLLAAFAGSARSQPGTESILAAVLLLAAVVAYAFGVAWLTEFRTDRVRQALERRLPAWAPRGLPQSQG